MLSRRALSALVLAALVLASPAAARTRRAATPVRAVAVNPLDLLRDFAAAFWARGTRVSEKGGSGLDPNGLTTPWPGSGNDSGSKLDPNG